MIRSALCGTALAAVALGLGGCDWMPGKPIQSRDQWKAPSSITDFKTLYMENCNGCHGAQGLVSGAIALDNPTYLAVVPEERLREIIVNGVPGHAMPAFAEENGGMLKDSQIDILVKGIMGWAKNPPPAGPFPPYAAPLGNAATGATTFAKYCGSCHGVDGNGVQGKAGSVINPAYLGLVSDQYLRSITIAGRNDLGCPDFQNRIPGQAMSDEEVSDVVAWLASQRRNEFGEPLPADQQ